MKPFQMPKSMFRLWGFILLSTLLSGCVSYTSSDFTAIASDANRFSDNMIKNVGISSFGFDMSRVSLPLDADKDSYKKAAINGFKDTLYVAGLLNKSETADFSIAVQILEIKRLSFIPITVEARVKYRFQGLNTEEVFELVSMSKSTGQIGFNPFTDVLKKNFREAMVRISRISFED